MIRFFRDKVQSVFVKVFIAIACLVMVLTGVEGFFNAQSVAKAAKVEGESITQQQVDQETQRLINQIAQRQGENFDPDSVDAAMLRPTAIDNIVGRTLLEQLGHDLDMAVSNTAVDKLITDQQYFQEDGVFSKDRFLALLRSSNISPNVYKALVADDILVDQVGSVIARGAFVTDAEVEAMIKMDYQTRDVSYIKLTSTVAAETVSVTDEDIQQYYDDNPDQFLTEEKVAVDYIELKLETFFEDVSDEDLNQAYDQYVADMILPTQRQAAHILIEFDGDKDKVAAETTLLELKARAEAGETFADLAKEYSQDFASADTGGDLGYTTGELFPAAFEEALAQLELGGLSEPVETEAGLHLIKLLDVQVSDTPTLADLTPMLKEQLQRLDATPRFEKQLELMRDLAFDSDAMADIAAELNLSVENSGKFTRSGANNGLFSNSSLVELAFSEQVKDEARISDVAEITADDYVVMQLTALDKPEVKPLTSVQAVIGKQLRDEAINQALLAQSEALLEELNNGKSLAEIAESNQLELNAYEAVSRRAAKDADRQVVNAAFELTVIGDAAYGSSPLRDGNYAIFAVKNVADGDLAELGEQVVSSTKTLLQSLRGRSEYDAFQQALRDRADVDIF